MKKSQVLEQTVLFAHYVEPNKRQIFELPGDFDIPLSIARLRGGASLYEVIDYRLANQIGSVYSLGYLNFSKGKSNGNAWEYSELSPSIFPKTERILDRTQLEEILKKTKTIRTLNKWVPLIGWSMPGVEVLCDPQVGALSEEFIRQQVLSDKKHDRFYVDIPHWHAYHSITSTDLVLPMGQFMKNIE